MLHGVGGNGRLLSFIGVPLFSNGFEVVVPDLPGYGLSIINDKIHYDQRLQAVRDGSAVNKLVSRIGPEFLTFMSYIYMVLNCQ